MSDIMLRCGNSTAVIRLEGAQMTSFHGNDGREVIWQADPNVWASHAPILFPICGNPKDGKVIIDGVTYPMTKHGFARNAAFEIAKYGDDFVDLILTTNPENQKMYPFNFVFHVVYTLRENSFRTDFIVENKSDRVMPFTVGGHPAFIVPMEDGAVFTDYQLVFPTAESGRSLLVPGGLINGTETIPLENGRILPLDYSWFDTRDTLIFAEFNSRSVDLVHKISGKGLRIRYPKMEVLAVWSKPDAHANYICLEPWHGLPSLADENGNFEDRPYVTLLSPGMSHQCGYDVELI